MRKFIYGIMFILCFSCIVFADTMSGASTTLMPHKNELKNISGSSNNDFLAGKPTGLTIRGNPVLTSTTRKPKIGTIVIPNFTIAQNNYIVLHGNSHILDLYNSAGKLLSSYPVAVGKNGMGKTSSGDGKTPIGIYQIAFKASCYANEDGGYYVPQFNSNKQWEDLQKEYFMPPDGGNGGVAMILNYPNKEDVAAGRTGYGIMIHSTLLGGIGYDASHGCIRMSTQDARSLYRQVNVGTTVVIRDN
ncbi:MAG: L,D-transpeptidase [Fusobacteria bacterium]|nr:L,D-transpeptidase [Fusobacteriota bacterium]